MNTSETSHCRLCAELIPIEKLINLESDITRRHEIINKLNRVVTNSTIIFEKDILPNTVCVLCIQSLDNAFKFVEHVENAQKLLVNIYKQVKNEDLSDGDNIDNTEPLTLKNEDLSDDDNIDNTEPLTLKNEDLSDDDSIDNTDPLTLKNEDISDDDNIDNTGPLTLKNEDLSDDDNIDNTDPLTSYTPVKNEIVDNSVEVIKRNVTKPTPKPNLTWKDYKWTCAKCGSEYPSLEQYKTHLTTYHECCNAFKCTDCNKKMLRLDKFLLHVKRHRQYLKLSCYICNTKFTSCHKAMLHKKVHSKSENICAGCNTEFPNIEDLNQHIKLYYKNRAGSTIATTDTTDGLTCMICKKTFKNKGCLNGHLLIHAQRSPKKRVHICDRCGKGYYKKGDLAYHVTSHDEARPYQCEICKSDFKTIIRLNAHMKIHNEFKPFSCLQCSRRFRLKKQLKSHEIIHTDSLPFVCPYCSKAFRFKTLLNLHLRQHTGLKPYNCELCQRDFTNWSNYNKHMKRKHGTSMVKRKPNIIVKSPPVSQKS